MNKNKEIIKLSLLLLSLLLMVVLIVFNLIFLHLNSNLASIIIYSLITMSIIGLIVSYLLKNETIFKLFVVVSIILVCGYFIYFWLIKSGILNKIDSLYDIKRLILKYKNRGLLIYTIINFLQVTIIPLPSSVTILAGTAIFGPFKAFIFSSIGILLGSIFAFFIGRRCSKPILYWIFGQKKVEKYQKLLSNRTQLILFLTLFLPLFPDDLICMLAGMTDIDFKSFLIISLIARSFGIACLSFFGSGSIIPFTGWGIAIWCLIAILFITIVGFVYVKRKSISKVLFAKK